MGANDLYTIKGETLTAISKSIQKNRLNLGIADSVDTSNAGYNLITRRTQYNNLGDLDWNYNSEYGVFISSILTDTTTVSSGIEYSACSKYKRQSSGWSALQNGQFVVGDNGWSSSPKIVIKDTSFNGNTATFKTAMNGVMLQHQSISSYTEKVAKNVPLLSLDQNGCEFLREEWEKGLQLWDEQWEVGRINTTTGENQSANDRIRCKNYNRCKPNTTYFWNAIYTGIVFFYDINKNFISYIDLGGGSATTFNSPSNTYYFRFFESATYGTTYNHDIMITQSDHAYPYKPFDQSAHIKHEEAKLLNEEWEKALNLDSGVRKVDNNNNTCVFFKCPKAGVYTISIPITASYINLDVFNGSTLSTATNSNKLTVTLTEGQEACFFVRDSTDWNGVSRLAWVMLNEGSVAQPYQPYNGEIVHEKEVEELRLKSLYNLGAFDTVDRTNADYDVITRRTGYYTFDGSESMARNTSVASYALFIVNLNGNHDASPTAVGKGTPAICSKFIYTNSYANGLLDGRFNFNDLYISHIKGIANIRMDSITSVDDMRAYLVGVTLQYLLDEQYQYTERVIKGQNINIVDQNGANWLRSEWEKGLNLWQSSNQDFVEGYYLLTNWAELKPNTTYTILSNATVGEWIVINDNEETFGGGSVTTPITLKTASTIVNTRMYFNSGNNNVNVMLVEGNNPYPYQPYHGKVLHEEDIKTITRTNVNNEFSTAQSISGSGTQDTPLILKSAQNDCFVEFRNSSNSTITWLKASNSDNRLYGYHNSAYHKFAETDVDNEFSANQTIYNPASDTPLRLRSGSTICQIQFKHYNNGVITYLTADNSDHRLYGFHDSTYHKLLEEDDIAELKALVYDNVYPAVADYTVAYAQTFALPNTIDSDPAIFSAGTDLSNIKGNSVVVNQIITNGNFESTSSWTVTNGSFTVSNNVCSFTATSSGGTIRQGLLTTPTVGHKYMYMLEAKSSSTQRLRVLYNPNDWLGYLDVNVSSSWTLICNIFDMTSVSSNVFDIRNISANEDLQTVDIRNVALIDLTQWYGAGNEPTSVDDPKTQFVIKYLQDHPEYNTGSIVDSKLMKVISKGANIWDEEVESGSLNSEGQPTVSEGNLRTKNFISVVSGQTYYLYSGSATSGQFMIARFYDKNRNFLTSNYEGGYYNGAFVVPQGAYFLKFVLGTTYNHDICINIFNSAINGKYIPHIADKEYPVVAMGEINLGSLSWYYDSDKKVFYAGLQNAKSPSSSDESANLECELYLTAPYNDVNGVDGQNMRIGLKGNDNRLVISNTNYGSGSVSSFTNTLKGLILRYELANQSQNILRSAGSIKDTKVANGTITRRIGVVDMGSLTYTKQEDGLFWSIIPLAGNNTTHIMCEKYTYTSNTWGDVENGCMHLSSGGGENYLVIRDSAYNDATAFKNSLSGVYLYYELATPTTEQGSSLPENIEIQKGGSIECQYDSNAQTPCDVELQFAVSKYN